MKRRPPAAASRKTETASAADAGGIRRFRHRRFRFRRLRRLRRRPWRPWTIRWSVLIIRPGRWRSCWMPGRDGADGADAMLRRPSMEAMETILPWNHRRPLWINPSNQPPKTLTMNHTILSFHSIQFNSIHFNSIQLKSINSFMKSKSSRMRSKCSVK